MDLSGSWDYLEQVAAERLRNNKTSRHCSQFGEEIEVMGAAGELAARRFLGLEEVLHTHFDDGTDILLGGKHIDVKATKMAANIAYRLLQYPEWKPVKAQIILLTAIDLVRKSGVVIGYATKTEVLKAPINYQRKIPCHEVPIAELHPASELLTLVHRAPKALAYHRQFGQA